MIFFKFVFNRTSLDRLRRLTEFELEGKRQPLQNDFIAKAEFDLELFSDRYGRAGYLDRRSRTVAEWCRVACVVVPGVLLGLLCVVHAHSLWQVLVRSLLGFSFGAYLGVSAWLIALRLKMKEFEREVLFRAPLFLESLILVVEAGVGILPAIERVTAERRNLGAIDPVSRIFQTVYQLAAHGMPLEQALELVASHTHVRVLRHVLLHLDISANTGGEIIPALRGLSDHTHLEWRLSVEQRVRRLENFVVFPVFASVIGLIFLTAAVPIVPLLNLKTTLESRQELSVRNPGALQ